MIPYTSLPSWHHKKYFLFWYWDYKVFGKNCHTNF